MMSSVTAGATRIVAVPKFCVARFIAAVTVVSPIRWPRVLATPFCVTVDKEVLDDDLENSCVFQHQKLTNLQHLITLTSTSFQKCLKYRKVRKQKVNSEQGLYYTAEYE